MKPTPWQGSQSAQVRVITPLMRALVWTWPLPRHASQRVRVWLSVLVLVGRGCSGISPKSAGGGFNFFVMAAPHS